MQKLRVFLQPCFSYIKQLIIVWVIGLVFLVSDTAGLLDSLFGVQIPTVIYWYIVGAAYVVANLVIYVRLYQSTQNEIVEPDRKLFKEFDRDLPFRPSIEFLRENDLGNWFSLDALRPFFDFQNNWNDASHKFLNSELEENRAQLYQAIVEFTEFGARNTIHHHDFGNSRLIRPKGDGQIFHEVTAEYNQLAKAVFDGHQNLVVLAKKQLFI